MFSPNFGLIVISSEDIIALLVIAAFLIAGAISYLTWDKEQTCDFKKIKREVIVELDSTTANCPECGCEIEISGRSDGTCPNCKTFIDILRVRKYHSFVDPKE